MIYLNRSFDVLTFKEDSGQIVYEILLILMVRSALATGKIRQNFKYLAANGTVRGSSIRIATLKIGEIHLKEIGASVDEAEMRNSLLGMTFIKNAKG